MACLWILIYLLCNRTKFPLFTVMPTNPWKCVPFTSIRLVDLRFWKSRITSWFPDSLPLRFLFVSCTPASTQSKHTLERDSTQGKDLYPRVSGLQFFIVFGMIVAWLCDASMRSTGLCVAVWKAFYNLFKLLFVGKSWMDILLSINHNCIGGTICDSCFFCSACMHHFNLRV